MKKIVVVLGLSFIFFGCKQEIVDSDIKDLASKSEVVKSILDTNKHEYGIIKLPIATSSLNCDSKEFDAILRIVDLNGTVDYNSQLWWLRNYGNVFCNDTYYKCIIDYHIFKGATRATDFESLAKDHSENKNNPIIYYKISANDLKSFIYGNDFLKCYDYHVKFELKDSIATPIKGVFNSTAETYYSIPLLRGIILKLEEDKSNDLSKINFEFCNAKINKTNKVIFKVQDIKSYTSFYNFSQDPKMLPIFVF